MKIAGRVQEVVNGGEEADDILRASLAAVHEGAGAPWSAIAFVEEGQMAVGPVVGTAPDGAPAPALALPIVYRGDTVAALWLGSATPRRPRSPSSSAPPRCLRRTASSAGTPAARSGYLRPSDAGLDLRAARAGGVPRHRGALKLGDLFASPAGSSIPVNLKSKSSPAAVSKSTMPTLSMRSRKLW